MMMTQLMALGTMVREVEYE